MDLSTVQIILTLFTFVSVLGTCLLIVQYIDLEAKEQLSVRKKHKKVQEKKEESIEEALMSLFELNENENDKVRLCEFEGTTPPVGLAVKSSIVKLSKKDSRLGITQILAISMVIVLIFVIFGARTGSMLASGLGVVVACIYPYLIINLVSMHKGAGIQYDSQVAMRNLMSFYMDAPNFDVAVKNTLKVIKPGTLIHKKLTNYYNAVFNEGNGKEAAMKQMYDELSDDYYFRMFMLTAMKAETSKAEYKKALISIPRRYENLVVENKSLAFNMSCIFVIYVIGLIAMMAMFHFVKVFDPAVSTLLTTTAIGNFIQTVAFSIYAGSGLFVLQRMKLVKVN